VDEDRETNDPDNTKNKQMEEMDIDDVKYNSNENYKNMLQAEYRRYSEENKKYKKNIAETNLDFNIADLNLKSTGKSNSQNIQSSGVNLPVDNPDESANKEYMTIRTTEKNRDNLDIDEYKEECKK